MTPENLELLATLIRGHYSALAVQWFGADALGPQTLQALIAGGFLTEAELEAEGLLAGAFRVGAQQFPGAGPGLDDWQAAAMLATRMHGAALVVGLGNKVAADMTTLAISSNNRMAQRYKAKIAEAVATGLEKDKSWRQIRGEIAEALDEDYARDLDRIAATETQRAVNEGYASSVYKAHGPKAKVAVIPQPDACKTCLSFYLEASGKPRIYDLAALPDSTINFKKKKPEWVACKPPSHPWCHCQLVFVPAGWGFDDDWALTPA